MNRSSSRPPVFIGLAAALFMASMTAVCTAAQTPSTSQPSATQPAPAPSAAADRQIATVTQYCVSCHNDRAKTAGVSFQGITADSIGQHAEVFEKAVRKMRGRVMPPPGARQPDGPALDALVAWLEHTLDRSAAQAHVRDKVVLHRLNRKEYANAVRDLLGVEFDSHSVLPADDSLGGFDN